jgi:hypothetical protein
MPFPFHFSIFWNFFLKVDVPAGMPKHKTRHHGQLATFPETGI